MKLPLLVAGSVLAVLLTSAYAQPSGTTVPPATMPNANGTPEAPANGTMPNANGTMSTGVNSGGTTTTGSASGTVTTPAAPQCVPNAANSCTQPGTNCTPNAAPPVPMDCPPATVPSNR